jgi:hypothetical protein
VDFPHHVVDWNGQAWRNGDKCVHAVMVVCDARRFAGHPVFAGHARTAFSCMHIRIMRAIWVVRPAKRISATATCKSHVPRYCVPSDGRISMHARQVMRMKSGTSQ